MRKLGEDTGAGMRSLVLISIKDGQEALPDLAGLLRGVDGLPDAGLAVVVHNGGGLLVVGVETLLEGLGVVVGALDEGLAGDIVGHGLLGRVEGGVVGTAGCWVDQTTRDAGHEEGVVDLELDGVLEGLVAGLEHGVEALCLWDGAGEAVEDESRQRHVS